MDGHQSTAPVNGAKNNHHYILWSYLSLFIFDALFNLFSHMGGSEATPAGNPSIVIFGIIIGGIVGISLAGVSYKFHAGASVGAIIGLIMFIFTFVGTIMALLNPFNWFVYILFHVL